MPYPPADGAVQLLRGVDPLKDQSYFLASVPAAALACCAFPLGGLRKEAVRRLAAETGVPTAAKRSSAGICFIGGPRALVSKITYFCSDIVPVFCSETFPGQGGGAGTGGGGGGPDGRESAAAPASPS